MIHYINNKPHKNIQLNKAKRHAVAHYRHTQAVNTLKDTLTRIAIITAFAAVISVAFIVGTA